MRVLEATDSQQTSRDQVCDSGDRRSWLRWAIPAVLILAGGGCATTPAASTASATQATGADANAQRLAQVLAVAGKPVSSFRFERMTSFEPIGLSDLLVYTNPREAWLLHLDGTCRDLDFDPFLGLTSHMHRVSTLTDSVRVRDNPIPCRIEEIRPVDTASLAHRQPEVKGDLEIDRSSAPSPTHH
jgi:hypothetical protein